MIKCEQICVLLNCGDQISQGTVSAATDQLLKCWPWWLRHRMGMLNVASIGMYTISNIKTRSFIT